MPTSGRQSPVRALLLIACFASLLLLIHNYGCPLFFPGHLKLAPAKIRPEKPGTPSFAYTVPFNHSEPNDDYDWRSRVMLYEDGAPMLGNRAAHVTIETIGIGYFSHDPGRLIFSATDNSDPRTNGKEYDAYYPLLYSRTVGCSAAVIFVLALAGLWLIAPATPAERKAPAYPIRRFKLHLAASTATLAIALYCSTGTLSPYSNTTNPHVIPPCDYLYNVDHIHFQTLFNFVDGQPRSTWNGALFLRRILFPVLCYPFMKLWGFEIGGTIGSIAINLAGFVAFILILRRQIGARGAVLAAWLLALYPGATYWGGLPYVYSIIFPAGLLLGAGLFELHRAERLTRIMWLSLLMGVGYLGYDLIAYFLPASILVLLSRRKPVSAVLAALLQAAPLAAWLVVMHYGLHQNLENSNTASLRSVLGGLEHFPGIGVWWRTAKSVPDIGLAIFFGANFMVLPAVFLFVCAVNAVTSRVRFHPAECSLLAAGLAIFLVNNLAPEYASAWQWRGTWIARLYQPVFPAFVYFAARWFQSLPPLRLPARLGLGAALLAAGAGNFLIVFGPILDDPLHVSEEAFYRFYDHSANHAIYEQVLDRFGRRPLGFCAHKP